jgi:hypothetical protein
MVVACTWTTVPDFELTFIYFFVTRQQSVKNINDATVCMGKLSKQIRLIH